MTVHPACRAMASAFSMSFFGCLRSLIMPHGVASCQHCINRLCQIFLGKVLGARPGWSAGDGAAREPAVQAEAVVLEQDERDDEQERARDDVRAEDVERFGE